MPGLAPGMFAFVQREFLATKPAILGEEVLEKIAPRLAC
jgi:hypothetical protein